MKNYNVKVLENKELAKNIYDMLLDCQEAARQAEAGQFISVYTGNPAMLLPRPLSICEIDKAKGSFRIVYRIAGEGTETIAGFKSGDTVRIIAPLGNPFEISPQHKNFAVVGGGIGVPPLLELTKKLKKTAPGSSISVYLGFRDKEQVILEKDFLQYTDKVYITTDDGSYGTAGTVMQNLETSRGFDTVYACGPHIMLKNISLWADKQNIPCFVSMEERMACTVGACLACVVKVLENGNVTRKTVCANGPVFNSKELVWE